MDLHLNLPSASLPASMTGSSSRTFSCWVKNELTFDGTTTLGVGDYTTLGKYKVTVKEI